MLKIKIVSRLPAERWLRYFPDKTKTALGNCEFIFDQNNNKYDWLVVYEDLPKATKNGTSTGKIELACHPDNTLLVTTEPPNIKLYDPEYTRQFGHILTSHPSKYLPHQHRIYSQPALMWYCSDSADSWNFLNAPCPSKIKLISTVCSYKRQKHTLHNRRYDLTMELQPDLPEMDVFGRGIRNVENKANMMADYKYHLAIENYNGKHHWTEKLSDCFLACSLPFYSGCTNVEDYFPEKSFIKIDLWDTNKTRDIIQTAIANNEFEKRLPAIQEARRKVLEEYSFFATINKIIHENHRDTSATKNEWLLSRHAIRKKYPFTCIPRAIKKEVKHFFKR